MLNLVKICIENKKSHRVMVFHNSMAKITIQFWILVNSPLSPMYKLFS